MDASSRQDLSELQTTDAGRGDARNPSVDALLEHVDAKFDELRADLLKWNFLIWAGTMAVMLAILDYWVSR